MYRLSPFTYYIEALAGQGMCSELNGVLLRFNCSDSPRPRIHHLLVHRIFRA